ncbi:hypothetical protein NLB65_01415 [Candidatus Aminicenantes bacterium AC-335-B20]|nr:hypothetical protein [SCandidatus Aminicenantes bacterium Aminicenantia_JdfR_composite]MCP2597046.1 hypothetical protein [Candidatus Aminicenantes bacterium AC-335-G13]MCP2598000.1 hypothetical protein [Candidatus Aminicenantes bacterium AC-335-L06]MCP2599103.1 hypothetical protein [Candidatus Aminicenantes bacterium AC-335-B20]MCP2605652.1 hypothetical protein [Candidatus Aminicenantes bacterium AC-335-O07]MCP2606173.1 hypothetical protein [Candidatus Aminicenantes bacterium AC-708-I09]MC
MKQKILIFLVVFCFIFLVQNLPAKGKWEFNVHYSTWSLNLLKGMIEDMVNEAIEEEFKDEILKEHPNLIEAYYSQDVNFDSSGDNYGFEIRFYPGGEKGSFSIGFSIEKTKMKLSLDGKVRDEFTDGSYADLNAEGDFIMEPLSYNISFRWDIKPSWRVRPYFTFGFGVAPLNGDVTYSLIGQFYNGISGELESENISGEENLKDIEDVPSIVPIVQLSFGIKGEITENIHILFDAGIWNGFLLRGGLSFRI